jgi:uncharacterized damage-inducible protein DinB
MKNLFYYNWMVREEWFEWAKQFSNEELAATRTGGFGNILHTLLHIVVVEYDWINDLKGGGDYEFNLEEFETLHDVMALSNRWKKEVQDFVDDWTDELIDKQLILEDGKKIFTYGEVMNHVIAHEIHHIGQLSVWARELDSKPVSANFIGKGLR